MSGTFNHEDLVFKGKVKGLGSQTGFFGPVFFPKSQKPPAVLQVIFFFYLNTYVFKICKNIWPKSNEGVRFGIRCMVI